jgi:hypothetical protein
MDVKRYFSKASKGLRNIVLAPAAAIMLVGCAESMDTKLEKDHPLVWGYDVQIDTYGPYRNILVGEYLDSEKGFLRNEYVLGEGYKLNNYIKRVTLVNLPKGHSLTNFASAPFLSSVEDAVTPNNELEKALVGEPAEEPVEDNTSSDSSSGLFSNQPQLEYDPLFQQPLGE